MRIEFGISIIRASNPRAWVALYDGAEKVLGAENHPLAGEFSLFANAS
jgi:hypothetical protein